MTEHYYSRKPQTESRPRQWRCTLLGHSFLFETDSGVFSKSEVDFGSRLLIETFQMPDIEGVVLDVGCGYGPIGLAVAKEYPDRTVVMMDINERAVQLARKNAELNGIQNVRIFESDGVYVDEGVNVAAVLTNPPIRAGKETVFKIYDGAFHYLSDGGELWVVIQKKQGAPSTLKYLEEKFRFAEIMERKKGYWIIKAVK
ncbi:class I SAM-dependent methyltransferase [Ureibacillus sp. FSL K6-8385]|uniref:Class I SAM-dependent methyltransferase n=2 Tax=Bacillati TaxID=1783272 RepID=A0A540V459_9BACL|nr:class I SAM-dependent methyltransferase [Ureibacillus terrenus]MED3661695.1 class I SAM-dependent methyltransferase [Ureibacillus terrenus]MED3763523.1 class I SAM-dependent methyltransferase [Ureibacillus terrenus]TQE91013.1 class I SAM-dependent methyltransferase [Ureibacillus terrenus]